MQRPPRKIVLPQSRQDAGFPGGEVVRTVHNPTARITAVEFRVTGSPPLHKVYWRLAHEVRYLALEASANVSCEDLVSAESSVFFVRLVEWRPQKVGFGGFTRGLGRIGVDGHALALEDVEIANVLPAKSRLSRLLRVNDPGTIVQAVVAFEEDTDDGGKRALYKVCAIDLLARQTTELDALPGLFF